MDSLFTKQLERNTFQKNEEVYGDPYDVLPIKNKKYARECEEVYLGSRGITALINFEDFPNCENLWLNKNKLKKIEGLNSNFRIKNLYLQDNEIETLEGSLFYMKHIHTLILYNNKICNLENVLEFLKRFKYLRHLELHENPLNEEPNYRHRMIYHLPWLELLDKHKITDLERIKAEDIVKNDKVESILSVKKTQPKIGKQLNCSKNEKILFQTAKQITSQRIQDKSLMESKSKTDFSIFTVKNTKPPSNYGVLPPLVQENVDDDTKVTEKEKQLLTQLFSKRVRDPKKPTWIMTIDLDLFFDDLTEDEGCIGKVPLFEKELFTKAVSATVKENKVYWQDIRKQINIGDWRRMTKDEVDTKILNFYAKAESLRKNGEKEKATEVLLKAISIQKAVLFRDEKSENIVSANAKEKVDKDVRNDFVDYSNELYTKHPENLKKTLHTKIKIKK